MRVALPWRIVMVMTAAVLVFTVRMPVMIVTVVAGTVLMAVIVLTRRGVVAVVVRGVRVLVDRELRRRHARPQHLPRVDVGLTERKTPQRALEIGERQTGIEERSERHVARNPREAVEVEHATHRPLASMKL
jgi:hypothetical protein